MKGYQLIEMDFIDSLIKKTPVEVHVSVMSWLTYLLQNDSSLKKYQIEVDVIVADYHGEYPCIGLHYKDTSIGDIESEIQNKLVEYYKGNSFLSFYEYVLNNQEKIDQTIKEFKP